MRKCFDGAYECAHGYMFYTIYTCFMDWGIPEALNSIIIFGNWKIEYWTQYPKFVKNVLGSVNTS